MQRHPARHIYAHVCTRTRTAAGATTADTIRDAQAAETHVGHPIRLTHNQTTRAKRDAGTHVRTSSTTHAKWPDTVHGIILPGDARHTAFCHKGRDENKLKCGSS